MCNLFFDLYLFYISFFVILFISGQNAVASSIFNQDSQIRLSGNGIIRKNGQTSLNIQVEIGPGGGQQGGTGAGGFPPTGPRRPGPGGRRPGFGGRPPGLGGRRPGVGGRRPGFGGRRPGAGAGGPGAEEEGPGAEEEGPGTEEEGPGEEEEGPGAGTGTGGESITFLIVPQVFTN